MSSFLILHLLLIPIQFDFIGNFCQESARVFRVHVHLRIPELILSAGRKCYEDKPDVTFTMDADIAF